MPALPGTYTVTAPDPEDTASEPSRGRSVTRPDDDRADGEHTRHREP
ncbi:hypothetical protein ACFOVU_03880 [Nocardiopsis sediminis]|uniref:Uncharacterized protein n=1 Tax=Nocardiopsis sediminis TaxID=1778267 RepID=A0ABV8FI79_9ACTN